MGWKDRKHKEEPQPAETPAAEPAAEGPPDAEKPATAESAAPVDPLAEIQARIEALQRQVADLDNRRKRVERQAEESVKYAIQGLVLALLPVIDNFERALSHAEETAEARTLHDGLKLVHDQLLSVLRKFHVEKIEAQGQPFDPHLHEAIAQVESLEHPDQTVIEVHQQGYLLHDRLLRPASVIVSRSAPAESRPDAEPPSAAGDDEGGELENDTEE